MKKTTVLSLVGATLLLSSTASFASHQTMTFKVENKIFKKNQFDLHLIDAEDNCLDPVDVPEFTDCEWRWWPNRPK
ncbi:MAG: hypothetical protein ACI9SP_002341 [Arenicella sp.]|jgi:hypothetical protein